MGQNSSQIEHGGASQPPPPATVMAPTPVASSEQGVAATGSDNATIRELEPQSQEKTILTAELQTTDHARDVGVEPRRKKQKREENHSGTPGGLKAIKNEASAVNPRVGRHDGLEQPPQAPKQKLRKRKTETLAPGKQVLTPPESRQKGSRSYGMDATQQVSDWLTSQGTDEDVTAEPARSPVKTRKRKRSSIPHAPEETHSKPEGLETTLLVTEDQPRPTKKRKSRRDLLRVSDPTDRETPRAVPQHNNVASIKKAQKPKGGSDEMVTGAFSEEEVARVDEVFRSVRARLGITAQELNNHIQDYANASEFREQLHDAFPNRAKPALRRFCRRRYHNMQRGPWTEEQDDALRTGYARCPDKWSKISEFVDRTAEDCRDRWNKNLLHSDKRDRGPWSEEEEERLLVAVDECLEIVAKTLAEDLDLSEAMLTRKDRLGMVNWRVVSEKLEFRRTPKNCTEKYHAMKAREAGTTGKRRTQRPSAERQANKSHSLSNNVQTLLSRFADGDLYDVLAEICSSFPDHNVTFSHDSTMYSIISSKHPDSRFDAVRYLEKSPGALRRAAFKMALEKVGDETKSKLEAQSTLPAKAALLMRWITTQQKPEDLQRTFFLQFVGKPHGEHRAIFETVRAEATVQSLAKSKARKRRVRESGFGATAKSKKQFKSAEMVGDSDSEYEEAEDHNSELPERSGLSADLDDDESSEASVGPNSAAATHVKTSQDVRAGLKAELRFNTDSNGHSGHDDDEDDEIRSETQDESGEVRIKAEASPDGDNETSDADDQNGIDTRANEKSKRKNPIPSSSDAESGDVQVLNSSPPELPRYSPSTRKGPATRKIPATQLANEIVENNIYRKLKRPPPLNPKDYAPFSARKTMNREEVDKMETWLLDVLDEKHKSAAGKKQLIYYTKAQHLASATVYLLKNPKSSRFLQQVAADEKLGHDFMNVRDDPEEHARLTAEKKRRIRERRAAKNSLVLPMVDEEGLEKVIRADDGSSEAAFSDQSSGKMWSIADDPERAESSEEPVNPVHGLLGNRVVEIIEDTTPRSLRSRKHVEVAMGTDNGSQSRSPAHSRKLTNPGTKTGSDGKKTSGRHRGRWRKVGA